MILVVAEQRDGVLNRATWEAIAAAQQLADVVSGQGGASAPADVPLRILAMGPSADTAARELACAGASDVIVAEHEALTAYTADGHVMALHQIATQLTPSFIVLPHTYQTRDFAPMLAARLAMPLITDVTGMGDTLPVTFTRPMFQGRLAAEVRPTDGQPVIVSCQVGAFRADAVRAGETAHITTFQLTMDATSIRQHPEAPFRETRQAVDLSRADRIVAVGRGIKAEEHIAIARALAEALGAEVAASRPICDSGWLGMDRQVGSSGQTVAPSLYIAIGISGAIQHLVGMKGSRTIVAINTDAEAPIFEVADYGIVGDLFEIVPALIAELRKS